MKIVILLLVITQAAISQEYSATYRVTFVSDWTTQSHPIDFPRGAHFSSLIGHTHNEQGYIWRAGELASAGIESMAETGGTSTLRNEINQLFMQGSSNQLLFGAAANAVDSVSIEFEISLSHPLISLVTMIAPSPDWFVGVDSVNLIDNHFWVEELMVDLLPYDSGTDSGMSFNSGNQNTNPPESIFLIEENPLPDNVPFGAFYFERLSVTGNSPDVFFKSGFE